MASAEQLKALLKSHLEGDDERFFSVAMQVAAHEAKLGHGKLAVELRALIDQAKARRGIPPEGGEKPIPISRPRGELAGLLNVTYPKARLGEMVLDDTLSGQLKRIIREQRQASQILAHGLSPRRKLLLMGPPGTGKTMTASMLAGELGLPLFQVRLDGLITKYMGESAAKLRQVFEATDRTRGVYFFDEFDAIGSQRGLANDVGEIRRILNSFLQMIEQDESHSLIVAATNHPEILDHALFRRFDDVLHYEPPDESHIASVLKSRLGRMAAKGVSWKRLSNRAVGLSYAEVARASDETLKEALIEGRQEVSEEDIRWTLEERQRISSRLKRRNNNSGASGVRWRNKTISASDTSSLKGLWQRNAFVPRTRVAEALPCPTAIGTNMVARLFSMAVTARDNRDRGRPSAWSAAIDRLTADSEGQGDTPRLFVISAGNVIDPDAWAEYPASNTSDGIHDLGQSWNALTVGAATDLVQITEPDAGGYQPIAPAGGLGSFSTTSATWQSHWPLKPDVVFEGGNVAKDARYGCRV